MNNKLLTFLFAALVLLGGLNALESATKPKRSVLFTRDIKPVFKKSCASCHADVTNDLPDITRYATAYEYRYMIVKKVNDERSMPKHSPYITESERDLVEDWVTLGAKE